MQEWTAKCSDDSTSSDLMGRYINASVIVCVVIPNLQSFRLMELREMLKAVMWMVATSKVNSDVVQDQSRTKMLRVLSSCEMI